MPDVIAWAYAAALHCLDCADPDAGSTVEEPAAPILSGTEDEIALESDAVCDDCHSVIVHQHPDFMSRAQLAAALDRREEYDDDDDQQRRPPYEDEEYRYALALLDSDPSSARAIDVRFEERRRFEECR